MGIEIERKFLVCSDGWRATADGGAALEQGYLSSNAKATVRVRIFDGKRGVLTLKGAAKGYARAEYEYDIPPEDARELLEMSRPHVIEKRRYTVRHDGVLWEVDVFGGRHEGLIIAEVELEAEDQALALPDWVGREVSDDGRYYNASLSRTEAPPALDPAAT
jgi:adenylate cyclase